MSEGISWLLHIVYPLISNMSHVPKNLSSQNFTFEVLFPQMNVTRMVCRQSCLTPLTLQLLCCISTTACHMVCRQSCLTPPTLQLLCCISTTACHMVCRQSCLTPPTFQVPCYAFPWMCMGHVGRVVAADFNIIIIIT